jgi:hypothetical protein
MAAEDNARTTNPSAEKQRFGQQETAAETRVACSSDNAPPRHSTATAESVAHRRLCGGSSSDLIFYF